MRILLALLLCANLYAHPGTIAEIHDETITVETPDGNLWDFCGDGYHCGDMVLMIMDDCGTCELTDDKIVEVY